MFNSYSAAYNNLKINATNGTLIKSHPRSFTKWYHIESELGRKLHDSVPTSDRIVNYRHLEYKECVVLQSMIIGDKILLSEVIWLDDYLNVEA